MNTNQERLLKNNLSISFKDDWKDCLIVFVALAINQTIKQSSNQNNFKPSTLQSIMEYQEGRDKFIQAWGTLGTQWGINRTMAQIHAILLLSPVAMSAEDVMEGLKISRGNANMNLRALMDWELVYKELKPGERKEFFVAEKNMMEIAKAIATQRKKKELDPLVKVLEELSDVKGASDEEKEFAKVVNDFQVFSKKADSTLDTLIKSDANWLLGSFFKLM